MNIQFQSQMLGRMLGSAFKLGELRSVKLYFQQGKSLELVVTPRSGH